MNVKKFVVVLVFHSLSQTLFAQSSTEDFFPLAIGNQWTYNYYTTDFDELGNSYVADSGTASYTLVWSLPAVDSILWRCRQVRAIQETVAVPPDPWTVKRIRDTSEFYIIEYLAANHRLMTWPTTWQFVFFFDQQLPDSNLLFRYYPDAISDTLDLLLAQTWKGSMLQRYAISLQRITGLVRGDYDGPDIVGYIPIAHYRLKSVLLTTIQEQMSPISSREFLLLQNYPNPFNPATNIPFNISVESRLQILIHDVLGRIVQVLFDSQVSPGKYTLHWDASALPSGAYFCTARTRHQTSSTRLILLK